MKKLYFVRHGESEANAQGLFAGRWDVGLTKTGIDQAKMEGAQVKNLAIDRIVSSPLLRARQTAEIIAGEIGYPTDRIIYSDLFMEREYGRLQGRPWSDIDGIDFDKVEGIETTDQLMKRAKKASAFLHRIKEPRVLLVGHGTSGRAIRDQILKQHGEVEVSIEQEIPNARVVEWL